MDVERLLRWTYHTQRTDVVIARGDGLHDAEAGLDRVGGGGRSNLVGVLAVLELGSIIASSRGHGDLPPDAELVHRCEPSLDAQWFGRTLSQPDWLPGAVPIERPALDARGRQRMAYAPGDIHRNHGTPLLECVLSQRRIDAMRARYAAWHDELRRLAAHPLLARLQTWAVRPPSAPARPWLVAE